MAEQVQSRLLGMPRDALAGLLLAAIAIPEQLATARLAGMPPQAGLFTFAAGAIGFAIFGTNRFLSVGADSTVASIFAAGLTVLAVSGSPDYASLAALLSVMVGVVLITAALLRAGWIADLLSIPVTTGFMAGISIHIIVGQLPLVLGIQGSGGRLLTQFLELLQHLSESNPYTVAIGLFVLVAAQTTERVAPHWPGALLALAVVSVATFTLHLDQHGVEVLNAIPATFPQIAVPAALLNDVVDLTPLALIVSLVCMMQTAAVLRTFPSHPDGPRHVARDFGGIGAGCILSALIGGFVVNSSPPRTAVVVSAGGRSQAVSLVAVALAAAVLFGGNFLLAAIPHAALGGILIAVALRIFRMKEIIAIARHGGAEIWLVAASILLIVLLPIQTGMLASIVLSLLHSVYTVARPLCQELARAPGTTVWWPPQGEVGEHEPGVLVFAAAAPLNFTNAAYIRNQLTAEIDNAATPVRLVVLEASGVTDIDYTGAAMLQRLVTTLRAKGIEVALARLSAERAREHAVLTGVLDTIGADQEFRSVEDAVRKFKASAA